MKQKVVIVGSGMVGTSYAYSLINQEIASEIVLIDLNIDLAKGQVHDLNDGVFHLDRDITVKVGDYSDCKDADIVCITAGINQKPDQTRLELVEANSQIVKNITQEIMKNDFSGIFLIASNPVDIMTQVVLKVSEFPKNKVLGSGTVLDSGRLGMQIAELTKEKPSAIKTMIIGEHGDSSLPLWSQTIINDKPILEYIQEKNISLEELNKCYERSRDAAYTIINGKGATYYGIGIALANITKNIFNNTNKVLPVGSYFQGEYNLDDVYLGIPTVVNKDGIKEIKELNISEEEQELLNKSAEQIKTIIKKLDF